MTVFITAILLHSTFASACGGDENSNRPFDRVQARAHALLLKSKFAELDEMDNRSKELTAMMSDGQPLRGAFFAGLDGSDIICASRTASVEERTRRLQTLRDQVAAWHKAIPKATTPILLEAQFPMVNAWIVRGGEYASQVPPAAWPVRNDS